jgi:hypothetical protein
MGWEWEWGKFWDFLGDATGLLSCGFWGRVLKFWCVGRENICVGNLAWNDWYHVVSHVYGSWLRGDPRGWRAVDHREHVEGVIAIRRRRGNMIGFIVCRER